MSRSMCGLHALVMFAPFALSTPERAAFRAHLIRVAEALQAIEHAEAGSPDPQGEAAAIAACLRGHQVPGGPAMPDAGGRA